MTQKRRDNHSTEFGIWLRNQKELDSSLGFTATNIDYVWRNYKTGEWMLIEEKRYRGVPKFYQIEIFKMLDNILKINNKYKGFHVIVFENTSPDDGWIKIDNNIKTKNELIEFLRFKGLDNHHL